EAGAALVLAGHGIEVDQGLAVGVEGGVERAARAHAVEGELLVAVPFDLTVQIQDLAVGLDGDVALEGVAGESGDDPLAIAVERVVEGAVAQVAHDLAVGGPAGQVASGDDDLA